MKLHEATTHLYELNNSSLSRELDARRPQVSAPTNAASLSSQQHQQESTIAMEMICMDTTNKKHPRSNGGDFAEAMCCAGATDHHQQHKKRPRPLCADTKHNNSQTVLPEISTAECMDSDQMQSEHQQFSLKHTGVSSLAEHCYEWLCPQSHAVALIFISPCGNLRLQRLQGIFQSTQVIQVRGNEIIWTKQFATSLEHIGRCLVAAVVNATATYEAENYLLPGRFRLGYVEESSMLIS